MDAEGSAAVDPRRKLYGRRHGKKLRASQQYLLETLLPRLQVPGIVRAGEPGGQVIDRRALFGDGRPVWLEIGFGGGEHLVHQARTNPGVGLIGCEPFINGMAMALGQIEAAGVSNLALHAGDARDLIELAPAGLFGRVFLLYPDPWPKARHHRRRFANRENFALLAPAMEPGAELRLATDIGDYADHACAEVAEAPGWQLVSDKAEPWADWPGTRYEAKALRAGRSPRYLTFRRA